MQKDPCSEFQKRYPVGTVLRSIHEYESYSGRLTLATVSGYTRRFGDACALMLDSTRPKARAIPEYELCAWRVVPKNSTESKNAGRSSPRRTEPEDKEYDNPLTTLLRFRLSVAELVQLKTELKSATDFIRRHHHECSERFEASRMALSSKASSIYKEAEGQFQERIEWLAGQLTAEQVAAARTGLVRSLFTTDREAARERARVTQEDLRKTKCAMWAEIGRRIDPVLQELRELKPEDPWAKWWEHLRVSVLHKTIRRGERQIALKDALSVWRDLDSTIELLINRRKRKDRLAVLRAKAASSSEEARSLAESVKKDILSQFTLLAVCPYCGGPLGLDTAHADHIYPVSKGGQSIKSNMVYVCIECNSKKRADTLAQFLRRMGFDRSAVEARLELIGKDF